MPDLSSLVAPIMSDPQDETVTVETAGEQSQPVAVQSNPQEQLEAKPEEISTTPPQEEVKIDVENNHNTIEDKQIDPIAVVMEESGYLPQDILDKAKAFNERHTEPVIEKIQCDTANCKGRGKIFNTVEEFDQHVKERHIAGAPCKFCENKESILKTTNEYFTKCYTSKPQQMPFIEELSLSLDVHEDTIGNWAKKKIGDTEELEHPEFFAIYERLNTMQKLFLSKRVLGRYNPTGAISLLKWHHGMMETSKQILAGSKAEGEELKITITEEKPTITHD